MDSIEEGLLSTLVENDWLEDTYTIMMVIHHFQVQICAMFNLLFLFYLFFNHRKLCGYFEFLVLPTLAAYIRCYTYVLPVVAAEKCQI